MTHTLPMLSSFALLGLELCSLLAHCGGKPVAAALYGCIIRPVHTSNRQGGVYLVLDVRLVYAKQTRQSAVSTPDS